MAAIDTVRDFNINDAAVSLWTYRGPTGRADGVPNYTGRWARTSEDVNNALKRSFVDEVGRIEEVKNYSLLEENHETSALLIAFDETHAGYVTEKCAAETANSRASRREHIQNCRFYLAKFSFHDTIIHCVRKADMTWQTRRAKNFRTMVFSDEELDIDDRPRFDISSRFDFIIAGADILCINKRNFESILRYKQAHQDDFVKLQAEPEFAAAFSDLEPLVEFVGSNKIQLRRVSAIKQKGHYKDAGFMENLRARYGECGLTLEFNGQGQIVVTPETCSDIVTALLDHRLTSRFSEMYFDVPSSTAVDV